MISQTIILLLLFLADQICSSPPSHCPATCGDVAIPFPFGTSPHCSLDESLLITCNHSFSPPKPFLSNAEVLNVSLDGLIGVSSSVASDCYYTSGARVHSTISELTASPNFLVSSTRNKFIAIGCDLHALVEGSDPQRKEMIAGCVSWCNSMDSVGNGTCNGIGCCQTSIPKGMRGFSVDIHSFRNNTRVKSFSPCSYAFVVESEAFRFSSVDFEDLQKRKSVPIVLDWSVGNVTCQEALKNASTYGCRADHSECSHSSNGIGYLCHCSKGFEGNPYLVGGCKDIDECTTLEVVEGGVKKDGNGCHSKSKINGYTIFYVVSGKFLESDGLNMNYIDFFPRLHWIQMKRYYPVRTYTGNPPYISLWVLYSCKEGRFHGSCCWQLLDILEAKEKKVNNLRQKLFKRNGGNILESMLSKHSKFVLFKAEDLKKASNNYDENRVLYGESSLGVAYHGILPVDNCQVIIQMCNAVEHWDVEAFVRKMVSLSCFHHKNLVRLIGCCLETQVPLVVYEFIDSVTLHGYLHDDFHAIWHVRFRIAAQTADVLCYMHHGTEIPLVHGNINSYNILLDHDCNVKIHNPVSTRTRGCSDYCMIGYLDPEYFVSGVLTVKSDVYSFGVVLAELLTGEKVIDNVRPLQERTIANYFISYFRGNDLLMILDCRMDTEGEMDQITQVAKLAMRCLSLSSADRPTMKEVVMALEVAISKNSGSVSINANTSHEITTALGVVRRNRSI